jgi:hypothetical protein
VVCGGLGHCTFHHSIPGASKTDGVLDGSGTPAAGTTVEDSLAAGMDASYSRRVLYRSGLILLAERVELESGR